MEPEKMMDGLSAELAKALKDMSKAKSVEDKERYSNIVRNLAESLGVFLSLAHDMMEYDECEDDDRLTD